MSHSVQPRRDLPADCALFAQRLEALLDGELDGALADATLQHLQACTACQHRADHSWRYREAMVRARDTDRASAEMMERVRVLLRHAITPQQPPAH